MTEAEYQAAFPDKPLGISQGVFGAETDWHKPIHSDGLAVVPKRIKDAERYCDKLGIPTDFTTERGRPIIKSRAHRKALLKAFRVHDNNGGYGD